MSQFDEHKSFFPQGQGDPNWQRIFDEAAETPPPGVWDAIERELDQDKDNRVIIVPFWGRSSGWAWGAAAAVVLLLLGWWSLHDTTPARTNDVAQQSQSAKVPSGSNSNPAKSEATAPTSPSVTPTDEDTQLAANRPKPIETSKSGPELASNSTNRKITPSASAPRNLSQSITGELAAQQTRRVGPPSRRQEQNLDSPTDIASVNMSTAASKVAPNLTSTPPAPPAAATESVRLESTQAFIALSPLETRPMQLTKLYGTQRIIWFRPSESTDVPTDVTVRRDKAEHWASVSVMPSSFNPGVGLQPSSATYANTYASTNMVSGGSYTQMSSSVRSTAGPALTSQPDLSIAYQLSSGVQISNRWSVEAGVSYLEARSTVNTPVQTIVASMMSGSRLSNLYADALNNSRVLDNTITTAPSTPGTGGGAGPGGAGGPSGGGLGDSMKGLLNTNVYDVSRSQSLSNDYTFVQVPVQVGYQLRPQKRLGFTVLGGFLTNLFVRNTVNNQLNVTNSDGVYRPVTLSASTGLRLRYRPTRRWSASMAGLFQQAIQRGTRVGADLITRPQTMGVSVGLDYHF